MTRQRQRRLKPAAWLAFFALWFQALLPLAHHPAQMDMGLSAFGAAANLCMAPGSAPADPSDKSPTQKPPPCPICQTFQMLSGGFIPPSPASLVLPQSYRIARIVPIGADDPDQHIHFGARARAPPMRA